LTALFGGAAQYWLRVRPGPRLTDQNTWQPRLRAAYLNATWAIAAETQRNERLGSSDGSPNQQFRLARRPVVEDSLRLRVFEPLGDEDVDALRGQGIDIAKTLEGVPDRTEPGYWVLWTQVVDPADEALDARVYALDDATGIISFGDGQHGLIPPIGRDVILAESYRRGGGAAANRIAAWTKINLVTALAGVKAVVAPEGAAGGSDPQDAVETLRFAPANLRLRERALTLADFEMLALQVSRDIAQVRAISTSAGFRLVVAMRGRSATPAAAVVRELRSYLLNHASPTLAAAGAMDITGPREVLVRLELRLVVDAIESSGQVAKDARDRLAALLDPATGGHDGLGWPLGDMPSDTDIAAKLVGIAHLESILPSTIARLDGQALAPLKPFELVRLAPDGITVDALLETEAVV
jgi:hypothetical protein